MARIAGVDLCREKRVEKCLKFNARKFGFGEIVIIQSTISKKQIFLLNSITTFIIFFQLPTVYILAILIC